MGALAERGVTLKLTRPQAARGLHFQSPFERAHFLTIRNAKSPTSTKRPSPASPLSVRV